MKKISIEELITINDKIGDIHHVYNYEVGGKQRDEAIIDYNHLILDGELYHHTIINNYTKRYAPFDYDLNYAMLERIKNIAIIFYNQLDDDILKHDLYKGNCLIKKFYTFYVKQDDPYAVILKRI